MNDLTITNRRVTAIDIVIIITTTTTTTTATIVGCISGYRTIVNIGSTIANVGI
jgi:hypothetical protein